MVFSRGVWVWGEVFWPQWRRVTKWGPGFWLGYNIHNGAVMPFSMELSRLLASFRLHNRFQPSCLKKRSQYRACQSQFGAMTNLPSIRCQVCHSRLFNRFAHSAELGLGSWRIARTSGFDGRKRKMYECEGRRRNKQEGSEQRGRKDEEEQEGRMKKEKGRRKT